MFVLFYVLSPAAVVLQGQNGVVATDAILISLLFWPFADNACQPLFYATDQPVYCRVMPAIHSRRSWCQEAWCQAGSKPLLASDAWVPQAHNDPIPWQEHLGDAAVLIIDWLGLLLALATLGDRGPHLRHIPPAPCECASACQKPSPGPGVSCCCDS